MADQLDALEQLALSRLPDDATPSAVQQVHQTAERLRVASLRAADCAGGEAGLQRWRAELKGAR
jgi:hypothetical protein